MEKGLDKLKHLAEQSDLLSQLFVLMDLMPSISFYVKDRKGKFIALNRTAWEYCGVKSAEEAYGEGDKDYCPQERVALYEADEEKLMKTGKPLLGRVEPAPEMEGSARLVETNKLPITDHNGNVVGLIGFHRRMKRKQHFSPGLDKFSETVDYMHQNATNNLCCKQLAERACLSESRFNRIFRQKLGVSPLQYIKRVRIEHACRLLVETEETVTGVAYECGFYDHAHFTRAFKASMGVSPSVYRKKTQAGM